MDAIFRVKVIEDVGQGIFLLENGLDVVWDFDDDGVSGVLRDNESDDTYIILDDVRDPNTDQPIEYQLRKKGG